jgi:hypothetical protein
MREAALVHAADEVPEHRLGHLEVRDHAVAQRPHGRDRGGRAPDHALGLMADGVHVVGSRVHRDHRRL